MSRTSGRLDAPVAPSPTEFPLLLKPPDTPDDGKHKEASAKRANTVQNNRASVKNIDADDTPMTEGDPESVTNCLGDNQTPGGPTLGPSTSFRDMLVQGGSSIHRDDLEEAFLEENIRIEFPNGEEGLASVVINEVVVKELAKG
ncbi:hypothetical protein V2J09_022427 [Rumex salicifolius]